MQTKEELGLTNYEVAEILNAAGNSDFYDIMWEFAKMNNRKGSLSEWLANVIQEIEDLQL